MIVPRMTARVDIMQRAITQDSRGESVETWTTYINALPAQVRPLKGRDLYVAQQLQNEITTLVTVRYMPGITSDMRVVHAGTTYEIAGPPIDIEARGRVLQLNCRHIA